MLPVALIPLYQGFSSFPLMVENMVTRIVSLDVSLDADIV